MQAFRGPMKTLSYLLVPPQATRRLQVRGDPGRVYPFALNPYLETLKPTDSARGHGNADVGPNTEHSHPIVKVPCTALDDFA
jgi:hypothetical protein